MATGAIPGKFSIGVAAFALQWLFVLTACGSNGTASVTTNVVESTQQVYGVTPAIHDSFATEIGTMVVYSFQSQGECHIGARLGERQDSKWQFPWGIWSQVPCPGSAGSQAYSDWRGAMGGTKGTHSWWFTAGRIYDQSITDVFVIWSDGVVTPAIITDGLYYSFREGLDVNSKIVEAYDSTGQRVPQFNSP